MPNPALLPLTLYCALRYFAVCFGAGVVLGIFRNLILLSARGPLPALAIELPLILTICWFASKRLVVLVLGDHASLADLALAGVIAFMLLLSAEYMLGRFAIGLTAPQIVKHWTTLEGALGLCAQILFGLFPLLQRLAISRERSQYG